MSNLALIRGFEIDIPKTMLQHHITNIVDLEKHLKKLIKGRRESFRFLVLRVNANNTHESYKMYISHKYLAKDFKNREFVEGERYDHKQFFVVNRYKNYSGQYCGNIGSFMKRFDEVKQHIIPKKNDYSIYYDLFEEMYVF